MKVGQNRVLISVDGGQLEAVIYKPVSAKLAGYKIKSRCLTQHFNIFCVYFWELLVIIHLSDAAASHTSQSHNVRPRVLTASHVLPYVALRQSQSTSSPNVEVGCTAFLILRRTGLVLDPYISPIGAPSETLSLSLHRWLPRDVQPQPQDSRHTTTEDIHCGK
jgi:hypothetical protein